MNEKLSQAIEDLTLWRSCFVPVCTASSTGSTGQPFIEAFGTTASLIRFRELTKAADYELQARAAEEPEYKEAALALHKAIEGLHAARETIIERKARELAALVHGDQIAGIQKLVSQIQGGEA